MICRKIITAIIVVLSIAFSSHVYANALPIENNLTVSQAEPAKQPIDAQLISEADEVPAITDKPISKSKPWAEMSAGERTGFILFMPFVIPAVVIVGAWDIAVGTIKFLGPGAADVINKYR